MKIISERQVQAIWYDAALRPTSLLTDDGRKVEVVHPGQWNQEAGPDFKNAVLNIAGGQRLAGDVEVHLCPADWDLHGHGCDPKYRNVVAHVTWAEGVAPKTLPKGTVSIWLGRCYDSSLINPTLIDDSAYPHSCIDNEELRCGFGRGKKLDQLKSKLVEAGRHRLRMKARRLSGKLAEMVAQGMEAEEARAQLFYEEAMGAFGYRNNQRQFRSIARRVPFKTIRNESEVAKAAMLTAGGFEEWGRWGRPNNSPWRRLENAADLFTGGAIGEVLAATDFTPSACRELVRVLCGGRLLGRGRAAALLANVVVPMALNRKAAEEMPQWLPAEDVPGVVREMAFRLLGRDHNPAVIYANNELCIQGLIHLYREYCERNKNDCAACKAALN